MNIFVGNSTKYFFPLFTLNSAYYADLFALFYTIIHMLLSILCGLLTIQVCYIVKTVHVFHTNMRNIVIAILAQWFEIFVAKAIIFPYQMGIVIVGEDRPFQFWVSDTPAEMPQINKPDDLIPLFISGIMFLHYGFTLVFSVFILTCERSCATFFIKDYEKKPRAYIYISLLITAHSVTLLLACLATFEIINFTTGVAISGIVIVGAVLIYFIILHINIGIQKRLDKNDHKQDYYSLAIRFQAKENARSLELAKHVVLFSAAAIIIGIFLLVVAVFHLVDNHIIIIVTLTETVFNLNPLFVIPVGIYSVPVWRAKFLSELPILKRLRTMSRRKSPKVSATSDNTAEKEAELHFSQLSAAWK